VNARTKATYFFEGRTPPEFLRSHPCRRLYVVPFNTGMDWSGRVFVLDASITHDRTAFLQGFDALLRQCGEVLLAPRDLPRIRLDAASRERARIGRELHDGVVQGLAGLDLELEALKLRSGAMQADVMDSALRRLQERVRGELRSVRLLQQRARVVDVDGQRLMPMIADMVLRFRMETGIEAQLVTAERPVDLPPPVCVEVVRMVQEALVNVRRHSHATAVTVGMSCVPAVWTVTIADNGCGLKMRDRETGDGREPCLPAVIEERARAIGASLRAVDSQGQSGTHLEIAIPRRNAWKRDIRSES